MTSRKRSWPWTTTLMQQPPRQENTFPVARLPQRNEETGPNDDMTVDLFVDELV
jgi:hypothetical protein